MIPPTSSHGSCAIRPDLPSFRSSRHWPSEAIFDKLAMSAFEGTPLNFAMRDCGISAIAIAGIATEIGIEPTARHAADLGSFR